MTRTWTQSQVESIARDAIGAYCEALGGDRPDEQAAAVAMVEVSEGLAYDETTSAPLVETGRTPYDAPEASIPRKNALPITVELCEEDLREIQLRISPLKHLARAWEAIYNALENARVGR